MKRLIIATLVTFGLLGSVTEARARDAKGISYILGSSTCGEYLDAYSRTTLTFKGYYGPYGAWFAFGWINGYLSGYNQYVDNGKQNIIAKMTQNGTRRWIASWCQDNPSNSVYEATKALIKKLTNDTPPTN